MPTRRTLRRQIKEERLTIENAVLCILTGRADEVRKLMNEYSTPADIVQFFEDLIVYYTLRKLQGTL